MNPSLSDPNARPLVLMRFRPAWAYIDGIREFGRFFCETTFGTPELAERARVIIQETLENAVKYSTDTPDSELELMIRAQGGRIEFSVSSTPDPTHMVTLKDELASIEKLGPEEAYAAAFMRAASEPEAASRIGLARIRYEGNVELSLTEEPGGRIRLTAAGSL
jgi:hypothetical protein